MGVREDAVARVVVDSAVQVHRGLAVHRKQALTYMKLGGYRLGLLLNFNTELMKHGITRLIHGRPSTLSQTRPVNP